MDSITYRFLFSRHVLIQMPICVLGAYALKDLVCVGKLYHNGHNGILRKREKKELVHILITTLYNNRS
jgi:hypothetical protein